MTRMLVVRAVMYTGVGLDFIMFKYLPSELIITLKSVDHSLKVLLVWELRKNTFCTRVLSRL